MPKNFLNLLLPKSKYIARDRNNKLYVYTEKPVRWSCYWSLRGSYQISADIFGDIFSFIKWEDEEPWGIEDLKKLEVKKMINLKIHVSWLRQKKKMKCFSKKLRNRDFIGIRKAIVNHCQDNIFQIF